MIYDAHNQASYKLKVLFYRSVTKTLFLKHANFRMFRFAVKDQFKNKFDLIESKI